MSVGVFERTPSSGSLSVRQMSAGDVTWDDDQAAVKMSQSGGCLSESLLNKGLECGDTSASSSEL